MKIVTPNNHPHFIIAPFNYKLTEIEERQARLFFSKSFCYMIINSFSYKKNSFFNHSLYVFASN